MAEIRKYRVETRTHTGNGYNYEDLTGGVTFEAIDGEDAIMQYKDYLKDQVASFSNLTTDEIEAEFDKIDSMDCWSELAEEEVKDMYDTEAEARKALENISEPMTVIPDCGSDGKPFYRIGTWDDYRRSVAETVEFLYENAADYEGEDPDDLVETYGYTEDFAKDVCESIQKLLKEKKEKTWQAIVSYMDDDIREDVHLDMAPCSNEEFLKEYLKRDPNFAEILRTEFNMEV